jgi:hypothetical protein
MGKRVYGAFLTQIDGVPEAKKDTDERGKTQRKNEKSSILIIKKQRAPLKMPTRLRAARDSGF